MTTDFENSFDNDPNFINSDNIKNPLEPKKAIDLPIYNTKSALGEFLHGRSLLKLYKVFLEEYLNFAEKNKFIGLCIVLMSLGKYGKLQYQEVSKLKEDFRKRKPINRGDLEYWFNSKQERIEFLKSIIKELEDGE